MAGLLHFKLCLPSSGWAEQCVPLYCCSFPPVAYWPVCSSLLLFLPPSCLLTSLFLSAAVPPPVAYWPSLVASQREAINPHPTANTFNYFIQLSTGWDKHATFKGPFYCSTSSKKVTHLNAMFLETNTKLVYLPGGQKFDLPFLEPYSRIF